MSPENNERKFDEFLKRSLHEYYVPVRSNFTAELSDKIRNIEQQKILARVIRQERILLAALILFPLAVIVMMLVFPNLIICSEKLQATLYVIICNTIEQVIINYHLLIYYTIIVLACLYAAYQMLRPEN